METKTEKNPILTKVKPEHIQQVVASHFDPKWGSDYWIAKAKEKGMTPQDVKREVQDFESFKNVLGLHNNEEALEYEDSIRHSPVRTFIPKKFQDGRRVFVGETGGTTGDPKYGFFAEPFWHELLELTSFELDRHGFPKGVDWLWLGPTGPHAIGQYAKELGEYRGGIVHTVDLDPRIIKKFGQQKMDDALNLYLKHIADQASAIFRYQPPKVLFTTSVLLGKIAEKAPLDKMGIEGIIHGGTAMSPDDHKILVEERLKDIPLMGVYGSSDSGGSLQKILEKEDNYSLIYVPSEPFLTFRIVNPQTFEDVPYNSEGQVLRYRFTEEMIIPGFPERDLATRLEPRGIYKDVFPWDWVQDVHSPKAKKGEVQEGVY